MPTSLYDSLGGKDAIVAVVDDFSSRCAADGRINQKFARTDITRLRKMLVDQVCEATGGPCRYTGRDMKEAHLDMGVTAGEFTALVGNLIATLSQFKVPQAEQDELISALAPMQGDIVEDESGATGTPLPARYQAAAPLS